MSMEGKIIALTGGASGIGLATAKIISSRGATVCIADVDHNALAAAEEYFASKSAPFLVTKVDVSKRDEVDAWIDSIVEKYGRLNGAANCAGIIGKHHGIKAIADLEDDQWDKIIAVNLTGMMYCLRAQLRKAADQSSIVCVTSVQGVMGESPNLSCLLAKSDQLLSGFANHGAYGASKHGVVGLVRVAAKEVGSRNIRVNAVAPGAIQTPLMTKAEAIQGTGKHDEPTAIQRLGTAEEMGAVIAFLLGPESTFVTGSVYCADGGWAC